jgi:hypothetical protein
MYKLSPRLVALFAVAASVLGFTVAAQAKTTPKKTHVVVTSGTATVTPTTTTTAFLKAEKVTVTAIAPASIGTANSVTLQVVKGVFGNKHLVGVLALRGGVVFATATKTVKLRDLTVEHARKTWLSGRANGRELTFARLTALKMTVTGKQVTVTGEIHLTSAAAQMVNHLVGAKVAKAGYDLGSFTATLNLH